MIDITKKSDCCGCYACINICPKQCIVMNTDNEGFWYPKVDKEKCIDCSLCEKVCPVIQSINKKDYQSIAYACKNKNEEVRLSSSSGGVFTNLCEYVIENNGVVFGAGFNERFEVEHSKAITMSECEKFRGSKYVQSKIGNTYLEVKNYLDEGKIVLFSGTQCQIKGLNLYLRKTYDNLIAVDIICHGVPSPKIFDIHKNNLKKEYDSKIENISFRDKDKGWKNFSYSIKFKNGKRYIKIAKEDIFMKGFLGDLYLRPSCYECRAKNFTNGSDISLADYWGVQNKHQNFDDDKGVSLILINSKKGQYIFNKISDKIKKIESDLDYAISYNPCIVKPVKYNEKREKFFEDLNKDNLNEIIDKYTRVHIFRRALGKTRYVLGEIKKEIFKYKN